MIKATLLAWSFQDSHRRKFATLMSGSIFLLLILGGTPALADVPYTSVIVIDNPEYQEAPTRFGAGAKILGDIDGDGVLDFGVGAPFQDSGELIG